MTTVILDTHVVHWWSAEPHKLSAAATKALEAADQLAVSAITWYELAWLAQHERIALSVPISAWMDEMAPSVLTAGISPSIARTAVSLPSTFPGDPADRIIYATAIEHGWRLVTKDRNLRSHRHPGRVTLW